MTHQLVFAIFLFSMPLLPKAGMPPAQAPMNEAECMSQWQKTITSPVSLDPQETCQASNELPEVDNGKCTEIFHKLKESYDDCRQSAQRLCALVPNWYAGTQKCTDQLHCEKQPEQMNAQFARALKEHREDVLQLSRQLKGLADKGLDVSKQYASDIDELRRSLRTARTETARRHASTTAGEALERHANQDTTQILNLIDKAQKSTITLGEVDQLKSPYVYEQMSAVSITLQQKKNYDNYAQRLSSQENQARANVKATHENGSNLGTLKKEDSDRQSGIDRGIASIADSDMTSGDPSSLSNLASLSGLGAASLPPAAAPLGGETIPAVNGITSLGSNPATTAGLETSGGRGRAPFPQESSAKAPTGDATPALPTTSQQTTAESGTGTSAGVADIKSSAENTAAKTATSAAQRKDSTASTTGASAAPPSLRESLNARLARRDRSPAAYNSAVAGMGTEAAGLVPGSSLATTNGILGSSNHSEGAPFSPKSETGSGDPFFTMPGSETDGAVKDIVKDFESSVGEPLGERAIASEVQKSPEILKSESPSLFDRLRNVVSRCLKRGCVDAPRGKI